MQSRCLLNTFGQTDAILTSYSSSLNTSKMFIFKRPTKTARGFLSLNLTRTFQYNLNTYSISTTPRASRFVTPWHHFWKCEASFQIFWKWSRKWREWISFTKGKNNIFPSKWKPNTIDGMKVWGLNCSIKAGVCLQQAELLQFTFKYKIKRWL